MSCTSFSVNLHSIVCLNVKELLARSRCHLHLLPERMNKNANSSIPSAEINDVIRKKQLESSGILLEGVTVLL